MDLSVVIAAGLIAIMGVPHGALDPFVAYRSGLVNNLFTGVRFISIYLLIMLAVVASWLLLPELTLITFLLLSGVHFGRDWRQIVNWQGLGYGALVVGLPALTHTDQVAQIFSFLLFGASSDLSIQVLQIIAVVGALLVLAELRRINGWQRAEIAALMLASVICSPLWYFVGYFCLLHSPRHLVDEIAKIPQQQRKKVMLVTLITLVTTLAIFASVALGQWHKAPDINAFIYQLLFIGMAALTVPHMFLLAWADRGRA